MVQVRRAADTVNDFTRNRSRVAAQPLPNPTEPRESGNIWESRGHEAGDEDILWIEEGRMAREWGGGGGGGGMEIMLLLAAAAAADFCRTQCAGNEMDDAGQGEERTEEEEEEPADVQISDGLVNLAVITGRRMQQQKIRPCHYGTGSVQYGTINKMAT